MRYSSKGKYRSVISADDMLDTVYDKHKQAIDEYINKRAIHDHDPINDAHHIYLQYIQAMYYKEL